MKFLSVTTPYRRTQRPFLLDGHFKSRQSYDLTAVRVHEMLEENIALPEEDETQILSELPEKYRRILLDQEFEVHQGYDHGSTSWVCTDLKRTRILGQLLLSDVHLTTDLSGCDHVLVRKCMEVNFLWVRPEYRRSLRVSSVLRNQLARLFLSRNLLSDGEQSFHGAAAWSRTVDRQQGSNVARVVIDSHYHIEEFSEIKPSSRSESLRIGGPIFVRNGTEEDESIRVLLYR